MKKSVSILGLVIAICICVGGCAGKGASPQAVPFRGASPVVKPDVPAVLRQSEAAPEQRRMDVSLDKPAPSVTVSPETTEKLTALIKQLGNDDWRLREAAQHTLENWPVEELDAVEYFLNDACQSADLEVVLRANLILTALPARRLVTLSKGLLKEFPGIYSELSVLDVQSKFGILQTITSRDNAGKYIYEGRVTDSDISGIIELIVLGGIEGLAPDQIKVMMAIISGNEDVIYATYLTDKNITRSGWPRPIKITAPAARTIIVDLLKYPDDPVRWTAAIALRSRMDNDITAQLAGLLKHADWQVRQTAVSAIGKSAEKTIAPAIRELLGDKSDLVRGAAASALGEIGDNEAIPLLKALMDDCELVARAGAGIALVHLGAKDLVPPRVVDDIKQILPLCAGEWADRIRSALKQLGPDADGNK